MRWTWSSIGGPSSALRCARAHLERNSSPPASLRRSSVRPCASTPQASRSTIVFPTYLTRSSREPQKRSRPPALLQLSFQLLLTALRHGWPSRLDVDKAVAASLPSTVFARAYLQSLQRETRRALLANMVGNKTADEGRDASRVSRGRYKIIPAPGGSPVERVCACRARQKMALLLLAMCRPWRSLRRARRAGTSSRRTPFSFGDYKAEFGKATPLPRRRTD